LFDKNNILFYENCKGLYTLITIISEVFKHMSAIVYNVNRKSASYFSFSQSFEFCVLYVRNVHRLSATKSADLFIFIYKTILSFTIYALNIIVCAVRLMKHGCIAKTFYNVIIITKIYLNVISKRRLCRVTRI